MAKTKTRTDELFEADIDYSIPIDRFAKKAKALLNKLAREMKVPIRSEDAEYSDASARIGVDNFVTTEFLVAYDKAVRELAKTYKPLVPLNLPIVSVGVGSFEIVIEFS